MKETDLQKHKKILSEYFAGKIKFAFTDVRASSVKLMSYDGEKGQKRKPKKTDETCAFIVDMSDVQSYIGKSRIKQSFFDLVEMHMKQKGLKPSEVYRKAQISKQDFSRYVRPDVESVGRAMVFSLAVGLELSCAETKALLRSAGLGFNKRSKSDLIIMYCIENELYDIETVNMLLDEFGQKMLKTHCYKE